MPGQGASKKSILVVDDDRRLAATMSSILERGGYAVLEAYDGASAVVVCKESKPDLVLLDLMLPDVDGLEVLRQMREDESAPPVIFISGQGSMRAAVAALQLGAYDFMEKPVDPNRLRHLVRNALEVDKLQRELDRVSRLCGLLSDENVRLKYDLADSKPVRYASAAEDSRGSSKAVQRTILHGLKNEFALIAGSAMLIRRRGPVSPDSERELDVIERSGPDSEIMLRRLSVYLAMGRPPAQLLSLSELVERTASLAKPRLPSNVTLDVSVDPRTPQVSANMEEMMMVLLELITNATDALRTRGGTIRISAGYSVRRDMAYVSVTDDGPGLPPDVMDALFRKRVASRKGSGLGLLICRKVVTGLRGQLEHMTPPSGGAKVTAFLPRAGSTSAA